MPDSALPDQPPPAPNGRPATWDLVRADLARLARAGRWSPGAVAALDAEMAARDAVGRERYGTPLQPFNGRDSLVDAAQEILDACVYLRNAVEESAADDADPARLAGARVLYELMLTAALRCRNLVAAGPGDKISETQK